MSKVYYKKMSVSVVETLGPDVTNVCAVTKVERSIEKPFFET